MWTPLGLAARAATVAQLSSGRFVLGLGAGGYGPGFWASVGLPDRPIAVMREYVTEVRGPLAAMAAVTPSLIRDALRIGPGHGRARIAPHAGPPCRRLARGPVRPKIAGRTGTLEKVPSRCRDQAARSDR
jgi:alkanesulfonate monooxygenase SsuD/methylene tetrahydromethanopterin reductase-like flavin-dependent oxidoreductase (luciferase family)